MKKAITAIVLYTVAAVLVIPTAVTYLYGLDSSPSSTTDSAIENKNIIFGDGVQIKVMNPETEEIVETPFEDYIKGVVGAEMPALFEFEALKAQSVAARTYAVRKMKESQDAGEGTDVPYEIGQAYQTKEELRQKWGAHFEEYYKKVSDAVDSTRDEIMVYEEEPILAVFHSTSAGKTETAANVWGQDLPYLQSVDSIGDEQAPDFQTVTTMTQSQVIGRLQSKYTDLTLTEGKLLEQMQIVERTPAGYVKKVQLGNKLLTGKDIREALGLKSSDFTVAQNGENIVFTTKGYGHGAGMSQYGANFMAQQGSTYDEILKHYYQGVEITKR